MNESQKQNKKLSRNRHRTVQSKKETSQQPTQQQREGPPSPARLPLHPLPLPVTLTHHTPPFRFSGPTFSVCAKIDRPLISFLLHLLPPLTVSLDTPSPYPNPVTIQYIAQTVILNTQFIFIFVLFCSTLLTPVQSSLAQLQYICHYHTKLVMAIQSRGDRRAAFKLFLRKS